MSEIKIFNSPEFGAIRTVAIDGEPWFVGKDVADSLGYGNSRQALKTNVADDDKDVHGMDTPSGTQNMTIINESGLYSLILGSKLPNAKKFKRWVTSEVLPAIRRTGEYKTPEKSMTEYQRKTTEIKSQALALRRARFLSQQADKYDGAASQALRAYAVKEITGDFVIPLPELQRTYSAAEIGWKLGISANVVGRIAKAHNLKTEQYGLWVLDKAKHCDKEVSSFRYFENVIPEIRKAYQEEQKNVSE